MTTQFYTAAVIGAGSGGTLSLNALHASPRFTPIAVADMRTEARERATAHIPGLQTFATHRDLFAACQPDIVCVSTWAPSHLPITLDALDLPLTGLLVEKPLAASAANGAILLEAIRDRHLPVVVPHGLLVAEHSSQILELVREGAIGEIVLIEIQCRGWDIINAGIHWLNFCIVLLGDDPATEVLAAYDTSSRTYRDGVQVETVALTSVQTRSGARIIMHTGDYLRVSAPGNDTLFRVIGTRGTLEFYGWEPRYRLTNAANPMGRSVEVDQGPRSNHQRHLENLAAQMDAKQTDYTLAESSLAALELCEAAYRSSRERCAITLPLSSFATPPPNDWQPGEPYSGEDGGRNGRTL